MPFNFRGSFVLYVLTFPGDLDDHISYVSRIVCCRTPERYPLMTDQQALDEAIRLTAHTRYRDYLDPAHHDYDPRFWPIVRAIAEPALIPLSEALTLHRLVRACWYRAIWPPCGCSGARCGIRSAIVSHRDCLDCVRTHGA
ncbi:MAG: hypothetical protein ACLP9L_34300 [Thermoguttaceae bacterium]